MKEILESLISWTEKVNYTPEDLSDHLGIAAIILNDKNEMLMLEHVKYDMLTIPVGKVEKGQSVEDALKQEMKEEVNITPIKYKIVDKFVKKYRRPTGLVAVEQHIFLIEKYKGKLKNNEPKKHTKMIFMSLDEIKNVKKEISDATIYAIKFLEK